MSDRYGLKVSRTGYDVDDPNTEERFFNVDSSKNQLKIAVEGLYEDQLQPLPDLGFTFDVDHNLGYKPMVRMFFWDADSDLWYIAPAIAETTWDYYGNWEHVDENTVRFTMDVNGLNAPGSAYDAKVKYYIFVDPQKDAWYE